MPAVNITHIHVRIDYDTDDVIELEPREDKSIGKWRTRIGWFFLSIAMSAFYKIKGWSISVNGSIKRNNNPKE